GVVRLRAAVPAWETSAADPTATATARPTACLFLMRTMVVLSRSERRQRETTQPLPVASKASLLHNGCTAYARAPRTMFWVFVHAHLSPFSLPCASFQPSCCAKK